MDGWLAGRTGWRNCSMNGASSAASQRQRVLYNFPTPFGEIHFLELNWHPQTRVMKISKEIRIWLFHTPRRPIRAHRIGPPHTVQCVKWTDDKRIKFDSFSLSLNFGLDNRIMTAWLERKSPLMKMRLEQSDWQVWMRFQRADDGWPTPGCDAGRREWQKFGKLRNGRLLNSI